MRSSQFVVSIQLWMHCLFIEFIVNERTHSQLQFQNIICFLICGYMEKCNLEIYEISQQKKYFGMEYNRLVLLSIYSLYVGFP